MPKWLIAILTLSLLPSVTLAQELEWSVDASVVLENREGGDAYTPDQTMMLTRLAPELGVSLLDKGHQLKGGVVWVQPMIDDMKGYKVLPTLYYRYNGDDGWHFSVGMMPRSLMVERMPRYLWSDSLNYFQPNLRGVMAQLVKPAGYAELAVDWRQLQTDYDREAFTAMLNADWRLAGPWSLGGHIQYSHLARSRLLAFEEHVNDDLVINPMTAIDLSRRAALDSLRLAAGAIISLDRDRGNMHWHNNAGFVAMATARWRWLQIDETFYAGNALMPLYPSCGSLINLGDPYYNNKLYDRLDLIFHIVSNRFVDLNGSMVFHFTDHVQGWWQQITCRFYLDNHLWKKRKDKEYLRDGWLRSVY